MRATRSAACGYMLDVRARFCRPEPCDILHCNFHANCGFQQDRAAFDEDSLPGLNDIVMDEELAAAILKASRTSMGMDSSPVDMSNIVVFCERMVKLAEYRRDLYAYLVDKVLRVEGSVLTALARKFAFCVMLVWCSTQLT